MPLNQDENCLRARAWLLDSTALRAADAAASLSPPAATAATIDKAEKARKEAELSPLRLGSKTSLRQIALPTTSSHAPCELQSTLPPPYHLQSNLCAGDPATAAAKDWGQNSHCSSTYSKYYLTYYTLLPVRQARSTYTHSSCLTIGRGFKSRLKRTILIGLP